MRRVLADTNILLAAIGWPDRASARAFWRILDEDRLVVTEYILKRVEFKPRSFPSMRGHSGNCSK